MKKAAIGMLVVFLLTVAFASRGDSQTVDKLGCITTLYHRLSLNGKVSAGVKVAGTWYNFYPKKMVRKASYALTYRQLARWEPVLANFRAALAAKVKVKIRSGKSTKRVTNIWFYFNQPC